jgi:uncharacterized membrane protein
VSFSTLTTILHLLTPHFSFPEGGGAAEFIVLRWLHLIFGIVWIGLLYFFNLVGFSTMKQLEAPLRAKIYPVMMSRAMAWFRWSAMITVVVGVRYYFHLLSVDAHNAEDAALTLKWFGWWVVVWLVAYALIYPLQLPHEGILDNPWVRTIGISIVVIAASWMVLDRNGGADVSNAHLCISVGGGLGLLMLLNAWGVVWRVQKRMIEWTRASAEQGTPMPPQAGRLARWSFLASRVGFWLSFPMLFFMGAAEHYPFLISMPR